MDSPEREAWEALIAPKGNISLNIRKAFGLGPERIRKEFFLLLFLRDHKPLDIAKKEPLPAWHAEGISRNNGRGHTHPRHRNRSSPCILFLVLHRCIPIQEGILSRALEMNFPCEFRVGLFLAGFIFFTVIFICSNLNPCSSIVRISALPETQICTIDFPRSVKRSRLRTSR